MAEPVLSTRSASQYLQQTLEATDALYRATHMAHWNIRGPFFPQLHALFEEQYNELWTSLDEIAERIRAVGDDVRPYDVVAPAPGHDAKTVLRELAATNHEIAQTLDAAVPQVDEGTADLFIQRIQAHEKHAWMLEATAEGLD